MRKVAIAFVTLLGVGCAGTRAATEQKEPLTANMTPVKFDPVVYASRYTQPLECEAMAQQLQARSRDQAWQTLEACVSHGNFLFLRALLSPQWLPDLRGRPEAPALVTDVIAARGGDVDTDVHLLHGERIPLFTLSDGLGQPELYQGRLVLVRARVNAIKRVGKALVADVSEVELQSEVKEPRQISPTAEKHTDESYSQRDDRGRWGNEDVHQKHKTRRLTVPVYDNVSVDTGRNAMVTLEHPDPFFETGEEYLLLARFDGVSPPGPKEDAPTARLTLMHFQRPGALVIN